MSRAQRGAKRARLRREASERAAKKRAAAGTRNTVAGARNTQRPQAGDLRRITPDLVDDQVRESENAAIRREGRLCSVISVRLGADMLRRLDGVAEARCKAMEPVNGSVYLRNKPTRTMLITEALQDLFRKDKAK